MNRSSLIGKGVRDTLILLILIISIGGLQAIPYWDRASLDFQNLYAFHNCEHANNPYLVPGATCGDWGNRPMVYPPLKYWSFVWTRFLPFESARWIWISLLGTFTLGSLMVWVKGIQSAEFSAPSLFFALLLMFQFPMIFSLERGNSDAVVLALWTLGAYFFCRKNLLVGFCLFTVAAHYKVYPLVGLITVAASYCAAVLFRGAKPKERILTLILSIGGVSGALFLLLGSFYISYVGEVLPRFSGEDSGPGYFSHSLTFLSVLFEGAPYVAVGVLMLLWTLFGFLTKDTPLLLAGALAISTTIGGTSYDYNFITAYPLLMLLFLRSFSLGDFLLLVGGLVGLVGHRGWWGALYHADPTYLGTHILIQIAFFAAVPTLGIFREYRRSGFITP